MNFQIWFYIFNSFLNQKLSIFRFYRNFQIILLQFK